MNNTDTGGAFVAHGHFAVDGAPNGSLSGLSFAAKDLFDVAGHPTGAGNPRWLDTHDKPTRTASAVQRCLDAGAKLTGKTLTDELAFSIIGANVHYGTPINPAAPDRVPGGSSSGSASAVAQGLVDFALGTDTGGSVRIPASFCGLYGMRPTHGRIAMDGVVPLAPSFDTVGWFARDVETLAKVGATLLGADSAPLGGETLIFPADAFALADSDVIDALLPAFDAVRALFPKHEQAPASDVPLARWMELFRLIQGEEAWKAHGEWIQFRKPAFGRPIKARFDFAATVTAEQAREARAERERLSAPLLARLIAGAVLCLPTSPCIAPLRKVKEADLDKVRYRIFETTAIAGFAGLPQITIPSGTLDGAPVGLSLIGARGADMALLGLAEKLVR